VARGSIQDAEITLTSISSSSGNDESGIPGRVVDIEVRLNDDMRKGQFLLKCL
jgi:hypothetical protein